MMKAKKKMLVLILFMCLGGISTAQNANVTLTKEVESYYLDRKLINNLTYEIYNNSKDSVWFWFSKNDSSKQSDFLRIREYFRIRPYKADFSFYELMTDGNVAGFTSSLFSFFVKVIPPGEKFIIQFITCDIDDSKTIGTIDSRLNIIPQIDIEKWLKMKVNNDLMKQFYFKSSFIAIPWSLFKAELTNVLP